MPSQWGSLMAARRVQSTPQQRSPQQKNSIYSCHSNTQDPLHPRPSKYMGGRSTSTSTTGFFSFASSSAFAASSIDSLMVSMFAKREFESTVTFLFFLARGSPAVPEAGGCLPLSELALQQAFQWPHWPSATLCAVPGSGCCRVSVLSDEYPEAVWE